MVSMSNTHIGIGLLSNSRRNEASRRFSEVTSVTVSERISPNAVTPSLRLRSSLSISNWSLLPLLTTSCSRPITSGRHSRLPPAPSLRQSRAEVGILSSRAAPSL